ncbi:MAG TPA: rhodanese-like domain-containing protein [Terriglobia bacterium]|nr:rhodanese-like domain-containing protein [Terriglobia bacterium]
MADSIRISKEELKRRMDSGEEIVFLDIRNPGPWERSERKIKGAIRMPLNKIDEHIAAIPKDKPVVAYCT